MTPVLVPVSHEQLDRVRSEPLPGPVRGFTVTPTLCATYGLGPSDEEEADRTALLLAGLSALLEHGRRLALVVEAPSADTGDPLGEVSLSEVKWRDVSAIFADGPEAEDAVSAAGRAVEGLDLDSAWDAEEVQALMAEHDLLWYGPEEVETLLRV